MRFSFAHSHAFLGSQVVISDSDETQGACMVDFGDGTTVIGEWRSADNGMHLTAPAYRTARGTKVTRKR